MIRPINITPLSTSKDIEFTCNKCDSFGVIHLENSLVNVDSENKIIGDVELECSNGHKL